MGKYVIFGWCSSIWVVSLETLHSRRLHWTFRKISYAVASASLINFSKHPFFSSNVILICFRIFFFLFFYVFLLSSNRVQLAIEKKDSALELLQKENTTLKERCFKLEAVIRQQRKDYCIKWFVFLWIFFLYSFSFYIKMVYMYYI